MYYIDCMTKINVRQKGANGERQVCDLMQPVVDHVANELGMEAPRLHRNLMQASIGGEDIVGLPWYSIEVKRVEKLALAAWWEQAVTQAARKGSGASQWDELAKGGWKRLRRELPLPWAPPVGGWTPPAPAREAAALASPHATPGHDRRVPLVVYRQNGRRWSVLMEGQLPSLGGVVPAVVSVAEGAFLHWLESDLRARLQRL